MHFKFFWSSFLPRSLLWVIGVLEKRDYSRKHFSLRWQHFTSHNTNNSHRTNQLIYTILFLPTPSQTKYCGSSWCYITYGNVDLKKITVIRFLVEIQERYWISVDASLIGNLLGLIGLSGFGWDRCSLSSECGMVSLS